MELTDYCTEKIVILVPDKLDRTTLDKIDFRELFVVDSNHYHGDSTPILLRMTHARLWHQNC